MAVPGTPCVEIDRTRFVLPGPKAVIATGSANPSLLPSLFNYLYVSHRLCVPLQQGKQLVMHAISAKDKPTLQQGRRDRVVMALLNIIYSTKKNEETGLPEPVVTHEVRPLLLLAPW